MSFLHVLLFLFLYHLIFNCLIYLPLAFFYLFFPLFPFSILPLGLIQYTAHWTLPSLRVTLGDVGFKLQTADSNPSFFYFHPNHPFFLQTIFCLVPPGLSLSSLLFLSDCTVKNKCGKMFVESGMLFKT